MLRKPIVFDLDGTLAESKSPFDAELSRLPHDLLSIVKVAVISGGDWPQFEKQVLSHLSHDESLVSLSLLPMADAGRKLPDEAAFGRMVRRTGALATG